ncbi:hypothetical protein HF086_017802 [Spodoptera exigua]|uniref:Retrotransposon gag domain-containing protein n=1 Tax=Spodoptera exigua TaxID=7107 RepID=A0A922MIV8_SPOEX|nr:hypothetical protein HF086_017802 [Spodoptera exigua]
MSGNSDQNIGDVSNADVTFFKNNHEDPGSSSEVGSEQTLIPSTPSVASVQPVTSETTQGSTRLISPASSNVSHFNSVQSTAMCIPAGTTYTPTTLPAALEIPGAPGVPFMPMAGTSSNQENVCTPGALIASGSSNTTTAHPTAPTVGVPPQFMLQMMEMMQRMSERLSSTPEPRIRIKDIYLPSFDPDSHVGVREWCQHIDKAAANYKLNDLDLRKKVCGLLKGRAKMWIDDWLVTTSSWEEFREKLITTFEPENRYSRDVLQFREHVYDSSKDISEFLSRAWVLWKRITKRSTG